MARQTLARYHSDSLTDFMNGPVRSWLNHGRQVIPEQVIWGGQATQVFKEQEGDFMRDAIAIVDDVLTSGVSTGDGLSTAFQQLLLGSRARLSRSCQQKSGLAFDRPQKQFQWAELAQQAYGRAKIVCSSLLLDRPPCCAQDCL